MSAPDHRHVLVHEWAFGALVLAFAVCIALAVGPCGELLVLTLVLAGQCVVVALGRARATPWRWHVRLWFCFVALNVVYATMRTAVPALGAWRWDDALAGLERRAFGALLSTHATAIARPWLTECCAACYLSFFANLLGAWLYHGRRGTSQFAAFVSGLMVVYAVGFAGYLLLPAAGPWLAFPAEFPVPLRGHALAALTDSIVAAGSNRVDAFPSLHCAVTLYVLGHDRRAAPARFRRWLLPALGLVGAVVYLRYHYLADVLAGGALAALGLRIATRSAHPDA